MFMENEIQRQQESPKDRVSLNKKNTHLTIDSSYPDQYAMTLRSNSVYRGHDDVPVTADDEEADLEYYKEVGDIEAYKESPEDLHKNNPDFFNLPYQDENHGQYNHFEEPNEVHSHMNNSSMHSYSDVPDNNSYYETYQRSPNTNTYNQDDIQFQETNFDETNNYNNPTTNHTVDLLSTMDRNKMAALETTVNDLSLQLKLQSHSREASRKIEHENGRLKRQLEKAENALLRQKKKMESMVEKVKEVDSITRSQKRELDIILSDKNKLALENEKQEVRINNLSAEINSLKKQLLEQPAPEFPDEITLRDKVSKLTMERDIVFDALDKQTILINTLKKQIYHLECIKMVDFSDREFKTAIGREQN